MDNRPRGLPRGLFKQETYAGKATKTPRAVINSSAYRSRDGRNINMYGTPFVIRHGRAVGGMAYTVRPVKITVKYRILLAAAR